MTNRYINLFTDYGFKKIFGEEPNKDLLIGFLNELLKGNEYISDLTYLNGERLGGSDRDRKAIFDLYCTNESGEKFIVEVQRVKQKFFKDRSVYYSAIAIQEQAAKGKDWKYELKSVYTIGILDFCFEESDSIKYHHKVQLLETETKELFYDKLTYVYLEVPKFNKELSSLTNDFERWVYAFKNLHKLEDQPKEFESGIFKRLMEVSEIAKYNKMEQQVYQESLKDYWDLKSSMDTYYDEGKEEGIQIGLEKGLEKAQQEKERIVRNLIQLGLDDVSISAATGFSIEEVLKFRG